MKLLYLGLKSSPAALRTLEELKEKGYNATLLSGESLRHAIDDFPEERHFLSLRHLEGNNGESVLCLLVLPDEKLEHAKETVRHVTGNFSIIKGFMFSFDVADYEGSL